MEKKKNLGGVDAPSWSTIKGYFTEADINCMLGQTNGDMDLGDCASVRKYASSNHQ